MSFIMEESLGFILNKTALASKATFLQTIKSYGISPEQWSVIYKVVEQKELTQKEIADATYKNQGNLTRMIDNLVKNDFLEKKADAKDRRAIKLSPTNKATHLAKEIIPLSQAHNEVLTKGFSKEEKTLLLTLLNKVHNNISKG